MTSERRSRWGDRAYHALLHATYPAHVRRRFGADMQHTFAAERAAARSRGRLALTACWTVAVLQACRFGTQARLDAIGGETHLPAAAPGTVATDRPGTRAGVTAALQGLRMDARYAVRILVRSPVFATTAVLSLAIGLAAFSTTVAIADALFLQAAPGVRGGAQLVDIARSTNGVGDAPLTYTAFETLRASSRTLEGMAAATRGAVAMSIHNGEDTRRVYGRPVSGNYFDILQVRPALGRFFVTAEDVAVAPRPVVVLSHDFWRNELHADPRVLDRPYRVNGILVDVVGVAEPGFEGTTILGADLWVPMAMTGLLRGTPLTAANLDDAWGWSDVRAIGRRRAGQSLEAVRAELNALFAVLRAQRSSIPASHDVAVTDSGRLPPRARRQFAAFVAMISALAAGLLAVACTNVAGMLLARAATRRHEVAMRLSLGASRARVVRQMMTETLVLFTVATLIALPSAWWLTRLVPQLLPANLSLPVRFDIAMSYRTVLIGAGMALAFGLVFGIAPARHALASNLLQLCAGRAASDHHARSRLRHLLVVAQVALSLAMAVTAGLLVRTLHAAAHVDLGFRTEHVLTASIDTSVIDANGADALPLIDRLTEELQAIGGVSAVGLGSVMPLRGDSMSLGAIRVDGAGGEASVPSVNWDVVSPDFFRAVGMPIMAGRVFEAGDRQGRPDVVIVNETFARAAWPARDAVGRQLRHTDATTQEERVLQVIGVVHDARYRYVSEAPRPMLFRPLAQVPQSRLHFYIDHVPGRVVTNEVRRAVARVEPRMPILLLRPFDEAAAVSLLPQRFAAWVAAGVGSVGTLLAALGLYGVVAFLVAQRSREFAIRMALGATQASVRTMVLAQAARLGTAGAGLGIVLAWWLGRQVERVGLLIGTSPSDPLTFAALLLGMGVVVLVASYVPARRATATSPASALRAQ
jgi:predicted permease